MKILNVKEMKMKVHNVLVAALLVTITIPATSQEYKIPTSGKTMKISFSDINKLEIEGTTGSDIIITGTDRSRENDKRAEGLKSISAMGLEDNTGLGLSAVDKNGTIEVNAISRNSDTRFIVKVPKNVTVKYQHNTPYGSDLAIRNVEGELDISSLYNDVILSNVTGPMTVNTVHGDIEAIFTTLNQASPSSLVSVHGHVDITLPSTAKADVSISTTWGEIYTDMDIQIEKGSELRKISSQTVKGKLNGGGVSLVLGSTHNNVYLRKK